MNGLQRLSADQVVREHRSPVDPTTLSQAAEIVEDVRRRGEEAIREHGERLGDIKPADTLVVESHELQAALGGVDPSTRSLLERVAERIGRFAEKQRSCLLDLDVDIPGGRAGHRWLPVRTAGAYAPGGRYPLPSTVLMTVIPARSPESKRCGSLRLTPRR